MQRLMKLENFFFARQFLPQMNSLFGAGFQGPGGGETNLQYYYSFRGTGMG
jgi:hypothetical protein